MSLAGAEDIDNGLKAALQSLCRLGRDAVKTHQATLSADQGQRMQKLGIQKRFQAFKAHCKMLPAHCQMHTGMGRY